MAALQATILPVGICLEAVITIFVHREESIRQNDASCRVESRMDGVAFGAVPGSNHAIRSTSGEHNARVRCLSLLFAVVAVLIRCCMQGSRHVEMSAVSQPPRVPDVGSSAGAQLTVTQSKSTTQCLKLLAYC